MSPSAPASADRRFATTRTSGCSRHRIGPAPATASTANATSTGSSSSPGPSASAARSTRSADSSKPGTRTGAPRCNTGCVRSSVRSSATPRPRSATSWRSPPSSSAPRPSSPPSRWTARAATDAPASASTSPRARRRRTPVPLGTKPDGGVPVACSLARRHGPANRGLAGRSPGSSSAGKPLDGGVRLVFGDDPSAQRHLPPHELAEYECCPFFAFRRHDRRARDGAEGDGPTGGRRRARRRVRSAA